MAAVAPLGGQSQLWFQLNPIPPSTILVVTASHTVKLANGATGRALLFLHLEADPFPVPLAPVQGWVQVVLRITVLRHGMGRKVKGRILGYFPHGDAVKCMALARKWSWCLRNEGCNLREENKTQEKWFRPKPFTIQFTSIDRRSIVKRHSPKIRSNQWGLEATIHYEYRSTFWSEQPVKLWISAFLKVNDKGKGKAAQTKWVCSCIHTNHPSFKWSAQ